MTSFDYGTDARSAKMATNCYVVDFCRELRKPTNNPQYKAFDYCDYYIRYLELNVNKC